MADRRPSLGAHVWFFTDRIYFAMGMERILVHGDGAKLRERNSLGRNHFK